MKNNFFNEFFTIFDQSFFENMNEKLEENFFSLLNQIKTCKASNEIILKFVEFFKEPLLIYLKKKDANFNVEVFFSKIFQENLVLTDLNLEKTEEFLKKLNVLQNNEMKDFMVGVLSQKIVKLEEENLALKAELEESRAIEMSLNEKIKEVNEKILETVKNSNEKFNNQEGEMKKIEKNCQEKLNNQEKEINEKIEKIIKDYEEKLNNQSKLNNESNEKINKNLKDSREEINQEMKKIQDKFIADLEKRTKMIEECIIYDYYTFCPENNDGNFTFSNLLRTLEKTSGGNGWRGFICENPLNFSEKLIFSIKIEKTIYGQIMIGFGVKNAKNSPCCHTQKTSFMLDSYNGQFNNRSIVSTYNSNNIHIIPKANDIYTSMLDVKQKTIEFLFNGKSLGAAKIIDLKNEEIPLLCPCVDLRYETDKVSIIKSFF